MNRKMLYLVMVGLALIGGGLAAEPATAFYCDWSIHSEPGSNGAHVDCFNGWIHAGVGNENLE